MHHFPKWLPEDIARHCQSKLDSGALSEEQEECILRLSTQEEMRLVWEALMKLTDNAKELIELFEFVRLHPTVMYPKHKTSQLTAAQQRKVLKEVSVLSERLIIALGQLSQVEPNTDKGMSFLKSELRRLQNQAAALQIEETVVHSHHYIEMLEAVDADCGIARTLQILHEATKLAMEAPAEGPRKKGAKNATRTSFIKELKRYVQFHFGKQLNQVVATIVNTAMNLPPETVTEDMVRKA